MQKINGLHEFLIHVHVNLRKVSMWKHRLAFVLACIFCGWLSIS